MSSTQKRGFRLPWGAERGADGSEDASAYDEGADAVADLGDGPFGLAEAMTQPESTDAAPQPSHANPATAEAEMIDSTSAAPEPQVDPSDDGPSAASSNGWPDRDRPVARPAIRARSGTAPASRTPRRENPLVAGLVKAMREAAIASREETTARLRAEAEARVEAIKARAGDEATELRKRADDDVAGIREWSKAEMARIRQETEERIEARKTALSGEVEAHAAGVERLIVDVQTTVDTYETEMDGFYERLLAEDDPARLATLAEQAPDPPDLSGEAPAFDWPAEAAAGDGDTDPTGGEHGPGLAAAAAAEAEAEATEGLDLSGGTDWPAAALSAARRGGVAGGEASGDAPDGDASTRLFVSGLSSVAGISAFKGAIGQLPDVRSVSVTSGERGVFIFTVIHEAAADVAGAVAGIPGFAARVTESRGEDLEITAHEPAA